MLKVLAQGLGLAHPSPICGVLKTRVVCWTFKTIITHTSPSLGYESREWHGRHVDIGGGRDGTCGRTAKGHKGGEMTGLCQSTIMAAKKCTCFTTPEEFGLTCAEESSAFSSLLRFVIRHNSLGRKKLMGIE